MDVKIVNDNQLGLIMFPFSDNVISKSINESGVWEANEVNWILRNTLSGMNCINIGANVGYHTMILSSKVGEKGVVHAYEPSSIVFNLLEENLKLKNIKNVKAIKKAVSNTNGNIKLYLNDSNCGDNRCFNPEQVIDLFGSHINHGFSEIPKKETVKCVKLDDEFNDEKIDLIFMDVQGLEFNVLRGAEKLIARNKPIIVFEFTPEWYNQIDANYMSYFEEFIAKNNYKVFILDSQEIPVNNLNEINDFIYSEKGNNLYVNLILRP